MEPPAVITPMDILSGYFCSASAGSMMLPMATMVAKDEPEMAAKNAQEAMVAITLPPRRRPNRMVMTCVRYLAVEPREAIVPEMMKNGMASST